ncbi:Nif3-like dinuclear metal center hexameric protein [Fundidesulfovibrio butyratiphilus]
MNIFEILKSIDRLAPPFMAASWDKSGVQVAGSLVQTDKIALALDPRPQIVAQALEWGAGLVLTHHPLAMTPRLPDRLDDYHAVLSQLFKRDAWLVSAHTNLDCAPDGTASWLADELGLTGRTILDPQGTIPSVMGLAKEVTMDGFSTLDLPKTVEVDRLHFDRDALRHTPQGFICRRDQWPDVKAALESCPDVSGLACVLPLAEPVQTYGYGLVGDLPEPLPYETFADTLWSVVPRSFWTVSGQTPATVSRVAYCTGSGSALAAKAFALGAQIYITGDVKHHQALEAEALGFTIDVGHHSLEEEMMRRLAPRLAAELPDGQVEVRFFPGCDPLRAVTKP